MRELTAELRLVAAVRQAQLGGNLLGKPSLWALYDEVKDAAQAAGVTAAQPAAAACRGGCSSSIC
jgi:hypothetical protein